MTRIDDKKRIDTQAAYDPAPPDTSSGQVETKKVNGKDVLARDSALARRTAGPSSAAKFAKQAAFDDVKRTLAVHPERADELIEKRLAGRNGTDRAIVRAAVAERGNVGLKRYADAEATLRDLGAFSPEERGDILGIMKAGASFQQAVADERRALSMLGPPRTSATPARDLRQEAIANVRAEAKQLRELGRTVGALVRQIGSPARAAELAAGVGSGAGLLGSAAWKTAKAGVTASTKPLKEIPDGARDAGEMMAAGVTGKGGRAGRIAAAEDTSRRYFQAADRYTTAHSQFERAARDGDYSTMTAAKREMDVAAADMRAQAKKLEVEVRVIAKWDANLAKGGVSAGMAVGAVAGAASAPPDGFWDVVLDRVLDIAVEEGSDAATAP